MKHSRYVSYLAVCIGALTGGSCQKASQIPRANVYEVWNQPNAPERLEWNFSRSFDELPLKGELDVAPWMDTYWPTAKGGINNRWAGTGQGFDLLSPNLETLQQMTEEQLRGLSPAEKYDAFVGRYDYPTVKLERGRTRPDAKSWEGLCHGWAPASLAFKEPGVVTLQGANGIRIPFGSSDIKALLIFLQGEAANPRPVNRMLGLRCGLRSGTFTDVSSASACKDVNAGAFHIVLTNYLGIRRHGFVVDRVRANEVWNHPVWKYKSRVISETEPSPQAAEGTVREVVLETDMTFAIETDAAWEPWSPRGVRADKTATYRYQVELNINDEIIGGEWISGDRPDFLWIAEGTDFSGYYSQVKSIYEASIGN